MKSGRYSRTALVVCVVLITAISIVLFYSFQPQGLTKLERRIVGEWVGTSTWTFQYASDHTFTTSDGEFSGTWHVESGRLHLRYWRPYDWSGGLRDHAERLFETHPTNHESWALVIADDDTNMKLSLPGNSMNLKRMAD